jgi:hypothetical protein
VKEKNKDVIKKKCYAKVERDDISTNRKKGGVIS